MPTLQATLEEAYEAVLPEVGQGALANYIPALARVPKTKLGAAIVTLDGEEARVGDSDEAFSMQSISKVFTLSMALQKVGATLWHRVGREPSGTAFNSIVQLEREHGIPRNPLINAGALVVSDVLLENRGVQETVGAIRDFVAGGLDASAVVVDAEVAASEAETGFRNASLANFLKSFRNLNHPVAAVLEVYFHQCALSLSCKALARADLFLAADGQDPLRGKRIVSPRRARRVNSVMLMCGHYDASGDFAFRVGLPGKSGVGGGILAIVPGRAAIAVWSPCLNEQGNSLAGTALLERIAAQTGWSVF